MSHYIWQLPSWPHFRWASEQLEQSLGRSRFRQGELLGRVRSLGFEATDEARQRFLVQEAVQTSAIEGVQLNPETVRSSVAKRLGLPTAGLQPATPQTDGLINLLLDATGRYDQPLTADRLQGWQAALFPTGYSGLFKVTTGQWRNTPLEVVSGAIGREKPHFVAPPPERLPLEMEGFLHWFNNESVGMDGLLRAAVAHLYFVTIHPFEDGNGRIARAVTDMALAQDENLGQRPYSLSVQIMAERDGYYAELESTQKGDGDITGWLLWFLGCFQRAITYSETVIDDVGRKARFWQRVAKLELSGHQRKVINRLLDAGPEGFEGGLTTRKFAGIAHVSRATAFREIADLVAKGLLRQNPGRGRSTSYSLQLDVMS